MCQCCIFYRQNIKNEEVGIFYKDYCLKKGIKLEDTRSTCKEWEMNTGIIPDANWRAEQGGGYLKRKMKVVHAKPCYPEKPSNVQKYKTLYDSNTSSD